MFNYQDKFLSHKITFSNEVKDESMIDYKLNIITSSATMANSSFFFLSIKPQFPAAYALFPLRSPLSSIWPGQILRRVIEEYKHIDICVISEIRRGRGDKKG